MTDVESVLYPGRSVQVGTFHCPPHHERFPGGRVDTHLVAFPWSAVVIQQEGAAPVVADPSVAVLYNPHVEYRRRMVDGRGDHCAWYAIDPDWLATDDAKRLFESNQANVSSSVFLRHRLMMEYLIATTDPDPLLVEEAALAHLSELSAQASTTPGHVSSRQGTATRHDDLVNDTRAYIALHFRAPLDLATIASAVGSSPFHLARIFNGSTGTTIHRHVVQLRLRDALGLLLDTSWDIATIAHHVGFSSHSHLTRRFASGFGAPPKGVRNLAIDELRKMVKV